MSVKKLFTSESVTEGHPDKLCDQVSDGVLDAVLAQDPKAHVACETCTTTGMVMVMGEMTTSCYVDIQQIVRDTVKKIGYDGSGDSFDYKTCAVLSSIRPDRRRRPGHDVWLCLPGDPRADACAYYLCA